ncbi:hypothetical protein VE03_07020 [Pseudogymnoascus sp. 23342-1-I1]|nr:hypothetical protein VE03_07020 [Pseudogymnoascus sp. 23342-1-I1]
MEANPITFLRTIEHVKYAEPSCCLPRAPQSSQWATEHMFRHALICLIVPLKDGMDRHKMVVMALVHDITDFRPWGDDQERKLLNMDYLACNLPLETANYLKAYWKEYWEGQTPEAQLAQEICAFEHMVALEEEGIPCEDSIQRILSSSHLQTWMALMDTSKDEMVALRNGASLGPSYWDDPEKNKLLLADVINTKKTASSPLPFIRMLRDMSTMKRKGWIERNMKEANVESIASHSWGVALICLLFSPKDKAVICAILGLVHDLGEIVVGDVTPADCIAPKDKQLHERFGQKFLAHLSLTDAVESYFKEFEDCRSIAAQITHEADSLECRIQAVIYILRYPQLKGLLEFLNPQLLPVYFKGLTSLLSHEESSLKDTRPDLTIIFVIGGPGVGKDTQCNRLADKFGFCHIPTGGLLREEIKQRPDSRHTKFLEASIALGFNVPAELMISLITAAAKGRELILNGFPRNFDQLLTFEQLVSPCYSTLLLDCPDEILRARHRKRAASSSRSDDSIIEKRLKDYHGEQHLRDYLQGRGPFETVDSTGSEEEVYILAKEGIELLIKPREPV